MATKNIIFYDLTSKPKNVSITPNVWKGRALLNYKQLPYETVWLEYPDVEPTLKPHVESPYGGNYILDYTVPTIVLPDGTYIMESLAIAKELEKRYPSPPLIIDDDTVKQAADAVGQIMFGVVALFVHSVTENTITDKSYDYFVRTRTAWFKGVPLKEVQAAASREQCLENARPALQILAEMLRKEAGPFVHGKDVGFADFVIVALWKMFERGAPDLLEEIFDTSPIFKDHFEVCKPWLQRDDH